jgi:hypothetical protein
MFRFAVRIAGMPLQLVLSRTLAAGTAALVIGCNGSIGGTNSGGISGMSPPGTGPGGVVIGPDGKPVLSSIASASVARRLSRSEIDATVRDLLGDTTNPASKYLQEDEYTPFDNNYERQQASAALIDSLEATADDVATQVMTAENRGKIVSCTPSGPGDAACFRQTIQTVGKRLFRRPLTDDEVTAYLGLQSFATENNPTVPHDFYTAVGLMLRSMLQDPEFLYRIEVGTPTSDTGVFKLNGYEIATRMSYLLVGSAPDDKLLDLAGSDALSDPAQRRTEATRLLGDPRAREQLHRFHAMWLGYHAIPGTADLIASFNLETTKLIDRVVFDQPASYLTLFSSPETYLNTALATQYGLPAPPGGEGWVPYGSSGRAGILSHGSVLAAFSKFSDTSPTQRGIFVQTRMLCNVVSPPPANVNVDQPPTESASACKIDRYAAHRASASCGACHNNLDPIGLGLENYDIGGKYRTHDDGHPECPIAGQGTLPGYGTFSGPAELGKKLLDSGKLEQCFVTQLMRFAVGRDLRDEEQGVVDTLSGSFKTSQYSLSDLLVGFVASDRFALRQEDPVQP